MAKSKTKKQSQQIWEIIRPNLLPITLIVLLIILFFLTYQVIFMDKYFPITLIGDTNVTLMTKPQAIRVLSGKFNQRISQKLDFSLNNQHFILDLATSSARLDYQVIDFAFLPTHTTTLPNRLLFQLKALISQAQFRPKINLSLDRQMDAINEQVLHPAQDAKLLFDETTTPEGSPSANIQIKKAQDGFELDKKSLQSMVEDYLIFGTIQNQLPTKEVPPKITTDHVQKAKEALEASQKESIKLSFEGNIWLLDTKGLLTLLDLTKGSDLLLDERTTKAYIQKIAAQLDQDVQEGQFEFNPDTKRVTVFKPSLEGRKLNQDLTFKLLSDAFLGKVSKNINLPVTIIKPKIETADVNNLGIKELIGRGISNFAGSIANRIYNVNLTASKINGVLIPPGEIFSFNQTVGDITAATGFKQAYVIKEGRTVLDDGGGVCQDSTTLFRAVLNAGLPVIKRTAHAYRVGYYEQGFPPGLDATVFYPSVDFQFKNDTPSHILIQAYTSGLTLYVDLYGTSDGRIASVSKSIITDQAPPPPDLRQDDPTLPKGTVKQVDFSAWGANVTFKRTVTRNSEVIAKETWRSSYKPWQAIYLVGTQ